MLVGDVPVFTTMQIVEQNIGLILSVWLELIFKDSSALLLLGFLLFLFLFSFNVEQADQTIRPRHLKLGQMVHRGKCLDTMTRPNQPMGEAIVPKQSISDIYSRNSYKVRHRFKNVTLLQFLGRSDQKWTRSDFLYNALFYH